MGPTRSLLAEIEQEEARLRDLDRRRDEASARLASLRERAAVLERARPTPPTPPAPVQLSPMRASEVSPPHTGTDKFRLFRELFRGREDVHPKYWENPAKGKKGYSPACANEWVPGLCDKKRVKCGACPHRAFIPISDPVILDHFKGRHVIGVYPMLEDETCWFLAADFDKTSMAASERLHIRNRVTWEREKGRGAKTNWKNSSEDIWFCTASHEYTFNVEAVKLRRKVIAPYRDDDGEPRDWKETADGNYRDTHPSNLWTDITVPFWSMPENTDHPTQKSEKLLAKLVLASTNPGDVVFDPFLGSGTASVVAKKLGRRYVGIECVEEFALLAEKRLSISGEDATIQGYADRVFWERNSFQAANGRSRSEQKPKNGRQQVQASFL